MIWSTFKHLREQGIVNPRSFIMAKYGLYILYAFKIIPSITV